MAPVKRIPQHWTIGNWDQGLRKVLWVRVKRVERLPRSAQDDCLEAGWRHCCVRHSRRVYGFAVIQDSNCEDKVAKNCDAFVVLILSYPSRGGFRELPSQQDAALAGKQSQPPLAPLVNVLHRHQILSPSISSTDASTLSARASRRMRYGLLL